MIEKMKVVHIVAAQTQKTELLDALRALGIVHFAEKADADQTYLERFAALSRLITVLEEQGVSEVEAETLDDVKFKQLYDGLNACLERKKALETERAAAVSACDTLRLGQLLPRRDQGIEGAGLRAALLPRGQKAPRFARGGQGSALPAARAGREAADRRHPRCAARLLRRRRVHPAGKEP